MEWATYLEHVRSDSARISEVALLGLDADVPCCPGWTVRDLVQHVGTVYTHKSMIIEEGWTERQDRPISPPNDGLIEWFDDSAAHLLDVLTAHEPSEPVWTWVEADQTVGFWYRRMAHETLIHRIDAEQAHGLVSEIDDELAIDGVDERERGSAMATYTGFFDIAGAVVGPSIGLIVSGTSYRVAFLFAGAMSVAAIFVMQLIVAPQHAARQRAAAAT